MTGGRRKSRRDALAAQHARLSERAEANAARFGPGGDCLQPAGPDTPVHCEPGISGVIFAPSGSASADRIATGERLDPAACIIRCYVTEGCRSVVHDDASGTCIAGGQQRAPDAVASPGTWRAYLLCD